jgi:hypothetical protein
MLFVRLARPSAILLIVVAVTWGAVQITGVVSRDQYSPNSWWIITLGLGMIALAVLLWDSMEPRSLTDAKVRRQRALLKQNRQHPQFFPALTPGPIRSHRDGGRFTQAPSTQR